MRNACSASTTGAHVSTRPSARRGCRPPTNQRHRSLPRSRTRCRLPPARIALSRSPERVPPGCPAQALRDLGRRARLLPALGQPGRPPGASRRGTADPGAGRTIGRVCTALQLTNFWQDFGRDWHNGRLYVPQRDLALAGAHEAELNGAHLTAAWKRVMADMVQRTRALFASGRPSVTASTAACAGNCASPGWAASRILDRIEAAGFDVLHDRPKLSARDAPALVWQALTWRTTSR